MDSERLLYLLGRQMDGPLSAPNLAVLVSRLRHKLPCPRAWTTPSPASAAKATACTCR